jgi:hypothetical protein
VCLTNSHCVTPAWASVTCCAILQLLPLLVLISQQSKQAAEQWPGTLIYCQAHTAPMTDTILMTAQGLNNLCALRFDPSLGTVACCGGEDLREAPCSGLSFGQASWDP